MEIGGPSQPAVGFFNQAVWLDQVEGNRLVEPPEAVLPGMFKFVFVVLGHNPFGLESCQHLGLLQFTPVNPPDVSLGATDGRGLLLVFLDEASEELVQRCCRIFADAAAGFTQGVNQTWL